MKTKPAGLGSIPARLFLAATLAVAVAFSQAQGGTITDANWTTVGPGMNGSVLASVMWGSNLYVGGTFTNAGGSNYVARWDGSNWTQVGASMNGAIRALAVIGTNLYAGGSFTQVSFLFYSHIARWDGTTWWGLGSGVNGDVDALAVSGTNLYVGGSFTTTISTVNHVARWNGFSWSALGPGLTNSTGGIVDVLAVSGNDLYAGGSFTMAGSLPVNGIARWDGSAWSALGGGVGGGILKFVDAIAFLGSDVYASGLFTKATNNGGVVVAATNIARWTGGAWTNVGLGLTGLLGANALAVSGSDLYAGGSFQFAGGNPASAIAKWDGTNWTALGSGVAGLSPPTVDTLAVSGSDLYVGGAFTNAGGKSCVRIARVFLGTIPVLSLARSGTQAVVSWPTADTDGFALEQAATLSAGSVWVSNTAAIDDDGTNRRVTVPATNGAKFFRLLRP
jgi:hypothetical protein